MKLFSDLSYEDLYSWFGRNTVSRGKSYQKGRQVLKIYQISENIICGSVQGNEIYDTVVSIFDTHTSTCSCPVGIDCKHGVALILEYLNRVKQGISLSEPPSNEYTKKYKLLLSPDSDTGDPHNLSSQNVGPVTKDYLKTLSKEELIKIVLSGIEGSRDIGVYLDRRQKIETNSHESSIESIIAEIEEVTSYEVDYSDWYEMDEEDAPDYSGILESFSILLEEKRYTDLLRLGLILLQKANHQVEMDDESGTISSRIFDCIAIVSEALELSDIPIHQKLLSTIEFIQADEYSLTDDIQDFFNRSHPESEWSKVADILIKDNFSDISEYHQKSQADWIEMALEKSGRIDEAIDFSRRIAEEEGRNLEYIRLLDRTNHKNEAIEWTLKSIQKNNKSPNTINQLIHEMRGICKEPADWIMITALDTEDFFRNPTINGYKQMISSAKKAGIANSVRPYIHAFLKDGTVPSSAKKGSIIPGLVPDTGVLYGRRYAQINPPVQPILLEMALDIEDPDEVIEWYIPHTDQHRYNAWTSPDDRIADALADKYPDKAIEIWKKQAKTIIDMKYPDHYHFAVKYIMKIRDVSSKTGKMDKFSEYLHNLKTDHGKKRRFIQELAILEGRTILDEI